MKNRIDAAIRKCRKLFQQADSIYVQDEILEMLNKLQRRRFNDFGEFLPSSDGNLYYFNKDMQVWFNDKSERLVS